MYETFADSYSTTEELQEEIYNSLPTLRDFVTASVPSVGPVQVVEALKTREQIRRNRWIVELRGVHSMGPIDSVEDLGDPDPQVSEQARKINTRLAQSASRVAEAARQAGTGDEITATQARTVGESLRNERAATRNIGAIRQWANIEPDYYENTRIREPSVRAAEAVQDLARSNLEYVSAAREQISKHRQVAIQPGRSDDILLDSVVVAYNEALRSDATTLPGPLRKQRINFNLTLRDGNDQWYFLNTSNQRITEYHPGKGNNPGIAAWTDESTLRSILRAQDPGKRFKQAYYNDEIVIDGKGIVNSFTIDLPQLVGDIVSDIARALGNLV